MLAPAPSTSAATAGSQRPRATRDIDVELGRRIRWLRMTRRMSQERLAEHLGVSTQMVQNYEAGRNRITVGRLLDIARALATTAAGILDAIEQERTS